MKQTTEYYRKRRAALSNLFVQYNDYQFRCELGSCQGKILNKKTTVLERHLKSFHRGAYEHFCKQMQSAVPGYTHERGTVNDSMAAVATAAATTATDAVNIAPATSASYDCSNSSDSVHLNEEEQLIRIDCTDILDEECIAEENRKHNIHLSIVELFVRNQRPTEMLEKQCFAVLMESLFNELHLVVEPKGLSELITSYVHQMKKKILAETKDKLVSLKLDAMTRYGTTLLSINAQYVKDAKLQIKTLAVKKVSSEYGIELLKSLISGVLYEFDLVKKNILSYTYDAGETLLQTPLSHYTNPQTPSHDIKPEIHNDFDNVTVMCLIEKNVVIDAIARSPAVAINCAASLFEVCISVACSNGMIQEKIETCRLIAKDLLQKSIANNSTLLQPIIDNSSNWLSTYDMLKRLLEIYDDADWSSFLHSSPAGIFLTESLPEFLREFLKIFEPFYNVTVRLQQENIIFSEYYVFIMDLIFKLENVQTTETTIKADLLAAIHEGKNDLFKNELFRAAVYLDPRIRICLKVEQQAEVRCFLKKLNDLVQELKGQNAKESSDPIILANNHTIHLNNIEQDTTPTSFGEYLETLDALPTLANRSVQIKRITVFDHDLSVYEKLPRLPLRADILEFWHQQNNSLSAIANMILAVPFTQVSLERLFIGLDFLAEESEDYKDFNIEDILFLRLNNDFEYRT